MKFLHDTWFCYRRALLERVRTPMWVVVSLAQPLLYLFLFGPLLTNIHLPGGAYNLFVPGLLVLMTYFVAGGAGFSVIEEANAGVIERFQVTPVDRSALVFGRAARDVTALVLQSLLLVGVGSLMGLRPDVAGVALSLVLISILALALSALSNSVGLAMQNGSAFAAVFNGLSIPVLLLSGVLLPLSLAPAWLQDVSDANPLRYAVDAARSLIGGRLTSAASLDGFAVTAALAVFAVAFAVHFFHRSIA